MKIEKREEYDLAYSKILDGVEGGAAGAKEVSLAYARIAEVHASFVNDLAVTRCALARMGKTFEEMKDENGKFISSTKAQAMLSATDEATEEAIYKGHVEATRVCLNGLDAILRTLLSAEKA